MVIKGWTTDGWRNETGKKLVSWQLLGIYFTVVHFTLQTELLKGPQASLQCTQSAQSSLQKFNICLLIYPLHEIVQCDATKLCPKRSVPCSA